MKKPKKEPVKKRPKATISFAGNSKKRNTFVYKIGSRFVTKEDYLKHAQISESELEFAAQMITKPLQNNKGLLKQSSKPVAKELINEYINSKDKFTEYELNVYITKESSLAVLSDKQIFVNGKELTFNELKYFFARILDAIGGVFYASVPFYVNEKDNKATASISVGDLVGKS